MPVRTSHAHGTFSWVELGTTDPQSAKKFYGQLFGWTFEDMPSGPDAIYTMCKLGSQYCAALYGMNESMKGVPAHWASYITVESVDATAKMAVANGGQLIKEPFDVMDAGRMAIVEDPTGAVFCLWTAKQHVGIGVVHDPGALTWSELLTGDTARATEFYQKTIGWSVQTVDMGPMGTYTLFNRRGEEANAAGMMALGPHMQGVPPHWVVYFAVLDCDASAAQATALGGRVVAPPMDIPNIGRFAIVADPQGATFAIYKGAH